MRLLWLLDRNVHADARLVGLHRAVIRPRCSSTQPTAAAIRSGSSASCLGAGAPALLSHDRRDTLASAIDTEKLAEALRSQGVRVDTRIHEARGCTIAAAGGSSRPFGAVPAALK